MRKTYNGREEDLGFKLHRQKSRRHQAVTVTDLDFADDLALEIYKAQEVLSRLEQGAEKVGLFCNAKKTETVKVKNGKTLKVVKNFKYLDSWTRKRHCSKESACMEFMSKL